MVEFNAKFVLIALAIIAVIGIVTGQLDKK